MPTYLTFISFKKMHTPSTDYVDYIFDDYKVDCKYIDAMDFLAEDIFDDDDILDDEDYIAGWNMTKAEVLGFENYEDCYSSFRW